MAQSIGTVGVDIEGDYDQFAGKTKKGLLGSFSGFGKALGGVILGGIVLDKAFDIGGQLFEQGQTAEVARAKVATVFEDSAGDIRAWADSNNEAFGLTDEQLAGVAGSFGDLLKPMGFTAEQASIMAQDTIGLSGALAAWSQGQYDAAEVSEILSKAMLGEREQLKSLGINISEAQVQNRLLEKGQKDLTGAELARAKALATQELIFESSTDAQAAWADGTFDSVKQANEAKAAFAEVKEELANGLRPAFVAGTKYLVKTVIPALKDLYAEFKERWPAIKETATTVFNGIRDVVEDVWPTVQRIITTAVAVITEVMTAVVDWVREHWPQIQETVRVVSEAVAGFVEEHWPAVQDTIVAAMEAVEAVVIRVTEAVQTIWDEWGDEILAVIERVWPVIETIITETLDIIQGVFEAFKALFEGDWEAMWEAVKEILESSWEIMKSVASLALDAIIEGVKAFGTALLEWMQDAMGKAKDAVSTGIDAVVEFFKALPGRIFGVLIALPGQIYDFFLVVLGLMLDGAVAGFVAVKEWFGGVPQKILDALGDLGSLLYNKGRELVQGFIDGIRSQAGAVASAVGGIVPGVGGGGAPLGNQTGGSFSGFAPGTTFSSSDANTSSGNTFNFNNTQVDPGTVQRSNEFAEAVSGG